MKVEFWVIGKTHESYLDKGIEIFSKRLKRYFPFKMEVIPDVKKGGKLPPIKLKEEEGKLVLNRLSQDDYLVLLDEKGADFTSQKYAKQVEKWLNLPKRKLVFLVGGAFGFSDEVYQRANQQIRLSSMTFSHQMIRVFFLEQLYRAMTILKNEPYHND